MTRLPSYFLIVIGLFYISGAWWHHLLDGYIFSTDGELQSTPLASFLFSIKWNVATGGFLGIPCLIFGVARATFLGWGEGAIWGHNRRSFVRSSISVSSVSCLFTLYMSRGFFLVEEGASIRPMGWSFFLFLISLLTAAVAFPLALKSLTRENHPILTRFALFYAFSPYILGMAIVGVAMKVRGFTLAE